MATLEQQAQTAPPAGTGLQKEQVVQRMFSSIARYYDLNNSLLSFGLHYGWKQQAIALVPLGSQHVLDVGSGTGDLALLAARRLGPEARILAADLNHPMLAVGLNKVRRGGLEGRILSVQANADGMCALDKTFDAVTTGFCLRNVGDLPKALREIHRVLRPGGRLVCLEFSRPIYALAASALRLVLIFAAAVDRHQGLRRYHGSLSVPAGFNPNLSRSRGTRPRNATGGFRRSGV